MQFLFTSTDKPISRLIEWGLKEDCSHFAVRSGELILDSDFDGFDVSTYEKWKKHRTIIHCLSPKEPLDQSVEDQLIRKILREFAGDDYDKPAFMYFAYRVLQLRLYGKPLPRTNQWGGPSPICVELMSVIQKEKPEWAGNKTDIDFGMLSPHKIYMLLKSTGLFVEIAKEI